MAGRVSPDVETAKEPRTTENSMAVGWALSARRTRIAISVVGAADTARK